MSGSIARPSFSPSGENYKVARAFIAGGVSVEKGFFFDGASAPNCTLNTLGLSRFDPRLIVAACVHDKAYRSGCVSRKEADLLFYNLLVQGGISRRKSNVLYRSVRAFGSKHYKGKK
jgi:hypothetical protein